MLEVCFLQAEGYHDVDGSLCVSTQATEQATEQQSEMGKWVHASSASLHFVVAWLLAVC